jgi:hypothetical protein
MKVIPAETSRAYLNCISTFILHFYWSEANIEHEEKNIFSSNIFTLNWLKHPNSLSWELNTRSWKSNFQCWNPIEKSLIETEWIPLTQIHDRSIFWLGTSNSTKNGGIKLVVSTHSLVSQFTNWSIMILLDIQ